LQNLLWVEENSGIEDLSLYFTAGAEYRTVEVDSAYDNYSDCITPKSFGSKKSSFSSVNLIRGGDNILVTDANKDLYLQLMIKHCTYGRFGRQATAVRQGVISVLPKTVLELFNGR
jgi:HECT-domain (ubiquitin-transferase)